jgi:dihydrofolate synthase/folylpolyglutamate synthase
VLRAAGYKTGLYTSPYIKEFGERMRVGGENIPKDTLAEITSYVRPIADAMEDRPTEFELITAIAFEYFRREGCEIVVLEAGMGGRLDSTNVIRNPLLSVITGIALDHTAFLGDTVEKIAVEKAGIIKDGAPVLFGGDSDAASDVIEAVARDGGSEFKRTDYSKLSISSATLDGAEFDYRSRVGVKIKLLALYQPKNASLVLDAVDILRERGLDIPENAVCEGLLAASWRARFEIIGKEPTVIFDGAHNPEGISVAVDSIKHYYKDKRVVVFTGVLRDKDYLTIARKISEIADSAFVITPESPRALAAEDYAEVLRGFGVDAVAMGSFREALTRGIAAAKAKDTALVSLGSLYTYSSVVDIVKELTT